MVAFIGLKHNNIEAKYYEGNNVMNFISNEQVRWKIEKTEKAADYYGEWKTAKGKVVELDDKMEIKLRDEVKVNLKQVKDNFKDQLGFFIPTESAYEPEDKSHNLQIIYRPIYNQYKINQVEWLGNGLAKYKTGKEATAYVNIFSNWEYSYRYIN